jgi:cbb3-type cytochrome oxidase subunit 1
MHVEPARKDIKAPLAIVILGIVIVVIGVLIYAWAMANAVHNVAGTDPNDPFGTFDQVMGDVSLVFASYAVMAIGGLVFLVGLIFLVLRMV